MASINELMMQGRAYQGMPPQLGGTSVQPFNPNVNAESIFSQPSALGFGNDFGNGFGNAFASPPLADPLAFANGAGAFGVPYVSSPFQTTVGVGLGPALGGYPNFQGLNQPSIGLPRQNTPTGYPPPVSGNKTNDIMFSVFQAVGIALKIRMGLNAQAQQQKALEAAQKQAQLDALMQQGAQLQSDMRSQWAEQDRAYEEAERRLGKSEDKKSSECGCDGVGEEVSLQREALAAKAKNVAYSLNSRGMCAKGVRMALNNSGIDVSPVQSAYQFADQLARRNDMKEVRYSERQAGDIVVFGRTSAKPHGHVAIQLEGNKQACDFVGNEANPNNYDGVRVFRLAAA